MKDEFNPKLQKCGNPETVVLTFTCEIFSLEERNFLKKSFWDKKNSL